MERDVGIVGYLTSTPGVGGTLKDAPEDFVVEEISSPPPPSAEGRFTVATIRVRNWETNRLVRELARALHVSRRRIGFAGTKDKHAVTTRLFSFEGIPIEAVRELHLKDVEVLDAFRSDRPLEIGGLAGNRFHIVIKKLAVDEATAARSVAETERALRLVGGFPSFFGVQRFGSVRPITHVVGRHLVRGEVRSALRDTGDVQQALRSYPRAYGFEKAILNRLATRPEDFVGALRALPFNLLMMFVHGYQSFLFNRVLSERIRRGLPIHEPVAGDLVLPADLRGLPDRSRTIEITCDNLERAAKRCREGKAWVSGILYGSEPEWAGGEPGQIEKAVVASEGIRPEDFIIPEIPRISSKGTRREILAPIRDLVSRLEGGNLTLAFELTRGSYATSLVREFTKSE